MRVLRLGLMVCPKRWCLTGTVDYREHQLVFVGRSVYQMSVKNTHLSFKNQFNLFDLIIVKKSVYKDL